MQFEVYQERSEAALGRGSQRKSNRSTEAEVRLKMRTCTQRKGVSSREIDSDGSQNTCKQRQFARVRARSLEEILTLSIVLLP